MSTPTDSPVVEQLSQGLLEHFDPQLKKIKAHFKELVVKQQKIETDMTLACNEISDEKLKPTFEMIEEMKLHKEKLLRIKKQIVHIHHKTRSLKKRAIYIKELKTKELEEKIRQLKLEEALIANNIASSSTDQAKPE